MYVCGGNEYIAFASYPSIAIGCYAHNYQILEEGEQRVRGGAGALSQSSGP